MKLYFLFSLLFIISYVSGVPTTQPTAQPLEVASPGALCSSMMPCQGFCLGPFKQLGGLKVGVCAPYEVGRGCLRACLEDTDVLCQYFPGNCLTCKEGKKLKEGRCL